MTYAQLIAAARAAIEACQRRAARAKEDADAILAAAGREQRTNLTADEDTRLDALLAERAAALEEEKTATAKLANYERQQAEDEAANNASRDVRDNATPPADRTGGARVTNEPRTYSREKSREGSASYFSDAYNAAVRGDMSARARLERHHQEAVIEGQVSERAQTTTTFAGLIVPQYLVDDVALLVRSGRPFANTVMHRPLPSQGMSFVIPRGTTGAAVLSQATENTAVQNTDEVWANLTVPVNTIAGQQDISRQSLERGTPGIDELVYMDLVGAYHAEIDRQCIAGTGASNQMLGMQLTVGINAATAFGAPPTYTLFNSKLAGQIAAVAAAGVGIDPQIILMHPRRWGWINTLVDTAGRPLVVPLANGAMNAGALNVAPGQIGAISVDGTDGYKVVGSMQGLPIVTDSNVPITVGTNSEDLVFVYDPTKIILWEDGDGQPNQLRFEQTLGNQLTVKLVLYGYAAFTAGRYPTAVGKIGGLDATATWGLVAPTF